LALKLVAECGTDLRAWKTAKHFTSWLCLAPGNKISGGKLLSSRTRRSSSCAAALLRLAATTIGRSDTALGAFYRRLGPGFLCKLSSTLYAVQELSDHLSVQRQNICGSKEVCSWFAQPKTVSDFSWEAAGHGPLKGKSFNACCVDLAQRLRRPTN